MNELSCQTFTITYAYVTPNCCNADCVLNVIVAVCPGASVTDCAGKST